MPPKPVTATATAATATATRRLGRTFPTTAGKSTPNCNPSTPINSPPPSSSTTAAVIPPPSTASRKPQPIKTYISENTLRKPPHTTVPASRTQPQNPQKTLVSNSAIAKPDDNKNEKSGESVELKNPGIEQFVPDNIEIVSAVGSGDGNKISEGSVKPVTGPDSGADGVSGPGKKKKKIVKKVLRVVKKVIKRRVPKRTLTHDSENQDLMVKEAESEVTKIPSLDNNEIEKSNSVDEIIDDKPSIVNEVNEIPKTADHIIESVNILNDELTEKTSIVNEVMEKENLADEQKPELVSLAVVSEPINIIGKCADASEIISSEQIVPPIDQSGISIGPSDNRKSNNVINCVPNSTEVEKVDCIAENAEVGNDCIKLNEGVVLSGYQSGISTGPSDNRKSNNVINCVPNSTEVEKVDCIAENAEAGNDCIKLNEGVVLSGELEMLERKRMRKTEIFVGGLSGNAREDDIRKVFEGVGVISEVRLVMSGGAKGRNRGFAFVRFATAADAKNALAKVSHVKICGKQCNLAPVGGNDTIFLGNLDKTWKTEYVKALLDKAGIQKIDKVTLRAHPRNVEKNRGFGFIEFETSRDAQFALNKLQKRDAFGKNPMVKVAWAQPPSETDEEEILKVKSVYAEYLPSSWDEEKVKQYFKRFGEIENVVLAKDLLSSRKDFAFIRYTNRDDALRCIEVVTRERSEDHSSKVKIAVSLASLNAKSKPMKQTPDPTSQPLPKAKPETIRTSIKLNEPRHDWKPASSSYNDVKVDKRPSTSTTDELVQILRQQAANKPIPPHPHLRTGTNAPDLHFPVSGSKRPFSQVGYDPLYVEPRGLPRTRIESSYPISGPSSSSRGVDVLPFPYHPQQRPAFTSESVIGRISYPSHIQERDQAPYYSDRNIYRRY